MKELSKLNFIFILAILISILKADMVPDIHFIISGTLNGTAAFVSLESSSENEKFLYFSFDFDFHSVSINKNKNIAYFLINSDLDFDKSSKEKINYGFLQKNWTEINSYNDLKDVEWENLDLLYKEKIYSDMNYYYQVKRNNDKMNTLILRIPKNGKKEGLISIENILELPDFNEKEKNTDI